jgi:hypothetical protein
VVDVDSFTCAEFIGCVRIPFPLVTRLFRQTLLSYCIISELVS